MSDRNCDRDRRGRNECGTNFREAVCIHTDKVYDSCRDKDCITDMRVYLTRAAQDIVDRAISIKSTRAEIIWVFPEVELTKSKFLWD